MFGTNVKAVFALVIICCAAAAYGSPTPSSDTLTDASMTDWNLSLASTPTLDDLNYPTPEPVSILIIASGVFSLFPVVRYR